MKKVLRKKKTKTSSNVVRYFTQENNGTLIKYRKQMKFLDGTLGMCWFSCV